MSRAACSFSDINMKRVYSRRGTCAISFTQSYYARFMLEQLRYKRAIAHIFRVTQITQRALIMPGNSRALRIAPID
jgi:hypothetical protein